MTTLYTYNFGLNLPDFRMGPWHDLVNDDFKKIDSLLIAAMNKAHVPAWQNSTHYLIGWTALDPADGTVWMAYYEHTSSPAPTTFAQERAANPDLWKKLIVGFSPRGQWQNNTMYLPWDLVYDTNRGIMALCLQRHVSSPFPAVITDDRQYWAFILDLSDEGIILASEVVYDHSITGIPANDVQVAIDYLQTEIVNVIVRLNGHDTAITNINSHLAIIDGHLVTIDNSISSINTSITNINNKNNSQDTAISNLSTQIASIPAGAAGPAGGAGPPGPPGSSSVAVRLSLAGEITTLAGGMVEMVEPYPGGVITGWASHWGADYPIPAIWRYRYVQVLTDNWYTVAYV